MEIWMAWCGSTDKCIMNIERVMWCHTSDLRTGKNRADWLEMRFKNTWKSLMLNMNWMLNLKDTNKIQQAWRGECPLICALRYCSHRSQSLWLRWGRRSITWRKWTLTLILISAGLEQISLHLSPTSQTFSNNNSLLIRLARATGISIIRWRAVGQGSTPQAVCKTGSFPHI